METNKFGKTINNKKQQLPGNYVLKEHIYVSIATLPGLLYVAVALKEYSWQHIYMRPSGYGTDSFSKKRLRCNLSLKTQQGQLKLDNQKVVDDFDDIEVQQAHDRNA